MGGGDGRPGPAGGPRPTRIGYAQTGEDIVVAVIFDYIKHPKPTYLDVGAHDPVRLNNTFLFYLQGSRGVRWSRTPT